MGYHRAILEVDDEYTIVAEWPVENCSRRCTCCERGGKTGNRANYRWNLECAYELHVHQQCKGTDQAAVAEREGLHPETVKGIFQRWARRAEKQHQRGFTRCLGVDEISLRKGHKHFAMVLSDLERHCILAVLPERSQEAFEEWLGGVLLAQSP